jgi:DNA-binding GntR family transcriptional regulator
MGRGNVDDRVTRTADLSSQTVRRSSRPPQRYDQSDSRSIEAYRAIRNAILSRKIQPGESLREDDLADMLEMSRTPVREALRQLVAEGIVERSERRIVVAELSVDAVRDAYDCIEVLEGLAGRLAATRATADMVASIQGALDDMGSASDRVDSSAWIEADFRFHEAIHIASGNERLLQQLSALYATIERVRHLYLLDGDQAERLAYATGIHREIIAPIVAGDADAAERVLRQVFASARDDNLGLLGRWVLPLRAKF